MTSEHGTANASGLRLFYSAPAPCPYLPGRVERRVVAELRGPIAQAQYDSLSLAGFRRSLRHAYRPACPGCRACVPVRVPAHAFEWTRSFRRVLGRNSDLRVGFRPPRATAEQFDLFSRYVTTRHGDGEMARMDAVDFRTMVEVGVLDGLIFEARDPEARLVAACLVDRLKTGYSAVYSFFDPGQPARSLGTFLILALVRRCLEARLDHVYLGYWIADSPKMAYKGRFRPLEALDDRGWRPI